MIMYRLKLVLGEGARFYSLLLIRCNKSWWLVEILLLGYVLKS
jgi:hypothetical protein